MKLLKMISNMFLLCSAEMRLFDTNVSKALERYRNGGGRF